MSAPFVFTGGVEASWRCLRALLDADLRPALAIGYPPSLAERSGYRSLADLARPAGIPLLETEDLNAAEVRGRFEALRPVLHVVAGWSQLIRRPLLELPSRGTVGFHPTRLPEGRGRAPIPWTLIKGLRRSAVTLLYLDAGVDSGDIVAQADFDIDEKDDAATVYEKVAALHVKLLLDYLPRILDGTAPRHPQDASAATYWPKRRPEDGDIDWNRPVLAVHDWIRALTRPYPGAFSRRDGRTFRVWKAAPAAVATAGAAPGTVLDVSADGALVACRDGSILLSRVEFDGDNETAGAELLRAGLFRKGDRLGV